ncbi:phage/plasmid primase, P4 family [Kiloniella sp.]|uniref:phage/plasmid primase, P4 family n=1 Tax=Kiloniella sp. TaxID=1938587 RepID=UPI003B018DD1
MTQNSVFGSVAADYYAAGLPVIPLYHQDKRPIPGDWSRFHDRLPTPEEQASWLQRQPHANIGLVLGEKSGICVVDIDTEDESIKELILKQLPSSPWCRVGKKGMVLAYRYNPSFSTFRIKDISGATLVEVLSSRTQVVLPPSIHPETKRPYEANVELLSVIDQLPVLDSEIEAILRGAFKTADIELSHSGWTKTTEWTPSGARDVQMTRVAGLWAYGVMRGELPLLEAIERMKAWYSTCTEKVAGDDVDIDKGIQNVVKFVLRDVIDRGKILPPQWDEGLTDEIKEQMGLKFDKDHVEWEFAELKKYLQTQFETYKPDTQERMDAIEYVLKKLSQSKMMSTLEKDRIIQYIVDASMMGLKKGSITQRIKELEAGEIAGTDHTQIAQAVIKDFEDITPLRYHGEKFWAWQGSHWEEKPEIEILRHIADRYGFLPAAKRNSDHGGIMRTMKSLVPQELKTFNVYGVNFANGVLAQNMKLRPHDPSFGMTYTLPFRYLPELSGKAFKFQEFLEKSWGHCDDYKERVMALQEALCSTIFGIGPSLQRAILLYGPPKSGKSQLLVIAQSLVPDSARSACPPENWNDTFSPAQMHQKLINVCGELSDKRPIDGRQFKKIVSGEEMEAQHKGKQIFRFNPVCTHWFASNHLPRTDDTSSGFNRRWLALCFDKVIHKDERVLDFGDTLVAEEREAIVAWAVEALPRVLSEREYTLPPSHTETMEEVATLNNSMRFFIQESAMVKIVSDKTSPSMSEKILYEKYYSFCLGVGDARPVGLKPFRSGMKELSLELGFGQKLTRNVRTGARECFYDGLIPVGK